MSNDLEDEIRDALRDRAMTVTAGDLNRGGEPLRTGRRPILAVLVTAAVVVALAIGIGVAVWPSSHNPSSQPAVGTANLADIDWRFVKGIQGTTSFTSPYPKVRVVFFDTGEFGADDSVNYISGRYRSTADGVALSQVGTTLVGYAGHDPNVLATQSAFGALTSGRSDVGVVINRDGQLVLSGPGYMLWFRNAGPAATPSAPASPTPTATSTGSPASYINGSELPASGAS